MTRAAQIAEEFHVFSGVLCTLNPLQAKSEPRTNQVPQYPQYKTRPNATCKDSVDYRKQTRSIVTAWATTAETAIAMRTSPASAGNSISNNYDNNHSEFENYTSSSRS